MPFKLIFRILIFPVLAVSFLVIPFLVLIRVGVFLHSSFALPGWLSLLGGGLVSFLLLYLFLLWIARRLGGKAKKKKKGSARRKNSLRIAAVLVILFCVYSLFFISAGNTKSDEVRSEYGEVHPILRMAVGAVTLFDPDMVMTDLSRSHADYGEMGLEAKKRSLHYKQEDGFVHAVDLRTKNRPEWRNSLNNFFFRLMGFRTLRHTGTEDHLHISLMIHARPDAI